MLCSNITLLWIYLYGNPIKLSVMFFEWYLFSWMGIAGLRSIQWKLFLHFHQANGRGGGVELGIRALKKKIHLQHLNERPNIELFFECIVFSAWYMRLNCSVTLTKRIINWTILFISLLDLVWSRFIDTQHIDISPTW